MYLKRKKSFFPRLLNYHSGKKDFFLPKISFKNLSSTTNYIPLHPAIAVLSASSLSGESFCSLLIVGSREPAEFLR